MRAVCWEGKETSGSKPSLNPEILNPRDAIIRSGATAICGSDLHLYNGYIRRSKGDVLGHESWARC